MEHLTLIKRPTRGQICCMIVITLITFGVIDYFFALHSVFGVNTPGSASKESKGMVLAEVTLRYVAGRGAEQLAQMPTVEGLTGSEIIAVSSSQEQHELERWGIEELVSPRVHYKYEIVKPTDELNLLKVIEVFQDQAIGIRKLLVGGIGHYNLDVRLKPFCKSLNKSGKCATLDVWLERRTLSRVRRLQNVGHMRWVDSFLFNSKNGSIQVYARYNALSDVLELLEVLQLEGLHPHSIGVVDSRLGAEN